MDDLGQQGSAVTGFKSLAPAVVITDNDYELDTRETV